ncbi:MAG: bifunctional riboflavin kinase/FAD synthetase [Nitrospinae bacterium]|nr:bifunctional riboflavin kinase/FAD synthetase [Nitrospinota bacterium]
MRIIRGTKNITGPIPYPVIAIGNFDGVHVGHQALFRKTAELATENEGTSIAFTFEPHPLKIIAPEKVPPLLTHFKKKMELIESFGINLVICADFTRKFADQQPRDFSKNILFEKIGVKEVVVGFDYAFGRGREGTIPYLKKMGEEFGFKVHVVDPFQVNGQTVSSSHVRELIESGEVEASSQFLGRDYSITGPVVSGYKTGQAIGFPTANIDTSKVQIPGTGVYAVRVVHEDNAHDGVANIGFNPTFNRDRLSVEVHIFDFNQVIYNHEIEVQFVARIRSEKTFKSADDLVVQIKQDIDKAREILKH